MKKGIVFLMVVAIVGVSTPASAGPNETGFSRNTTIVEGPSPDGDCPGELDCNWDGTIENGYSWGVGGVVPPDYGSFGDCYDNAFVCEGHFYFTQLGYYAGQTADIYIWADEGGLPGNVVCSSLGQGPGQIALWPSCSAHKFALNCDTGGAHFLGYWGDWPGMVEGWFICADEDGPMSCPVTKIAPGIGNYPSGWQPITVVPTFAGCKSLGICEWFGEPPVATESTTWGRIKALY